MAQPRPPATPCLLLLAEDEAWLAAVRGALGPAAGGACHTAASAEDAVMRLVRPGRRYSHLLVQPRLVGDWMPALVGLTGEDGSGTRLVLLGEPAGVPPLPLHLPEPRAEAVAASLAAGLPPAPAALDDAGLRAALARGGVEARFQPIVRVSDGAPLGLEVLARLHDPARGTFAAEMFVPQAERAGLSRQLTAAVTATALAALPAPLLRAHGLYLALNLPLDVLLVPESLDCLEGQRSGAGFSPSELVIELTESRPVCDLPGLAAAVARWRSAGYRLAIDDVGPEMPHHRTLLGLPFDAMKFAMEVVALSAGSEEARAYLRRTAALAKGQGLAVVAEGVEDEEGWDRVAALGVDAVQGFMVARPLPAGAVPVWLRHWAGRARPA